MHTNARILKAHSHSHSMSGGSIGASLECHFCFWIAGGLVPYHTMWLTSSYSKTTLTLNGSSDWTSTHWVWVWVSFYNMGVNVDSRLPIILFSGVRTGRAKGANPPPSFQKTQKVPSLRWQSALCLLKKCSENNLQFLRKVPVYKLMSMKQINSTFGLKLAHWKLSQSLHWILYAMTLVLIVPLN
jgi:hypothetical protein